MTPDEAKKLLGGYAAGTLTQAEREALFAAALEDQELFDALAREESLRELLADPAAKAALLAALDDRPRPWWRSWKPAAALVMAGLATLAVYVATRRPDVRIVATMQAPQASLSEPTLRPATIPPAVRQPLPPQPLPAPPRTRIARPVEERATVPPAPVTLAEAPKAESVRTDQPTGNVAGVPALPAAQDAAASPMFAPEARPMQARAAKEAAPPSARALFLGGAQPTVAIQAIGVQSGAQEPLGVRYSIQDDGAIRITANVNGYLSVGGRPPVALTARQPYTAPVPPPNTAEVIVVFSRQPQTAAPDSASLTEVAGRETYVVNPRGTAFSFRIPLRPQ